MKRSIAAGLLVLCMVASAALAAKGPAKGKDGKNDVMGATWTCTISRGKEQSSGRFRVYKNEIFKGAEKVGRIETKDEDETTLVITGIPELNGKAVLRKVKQRPPGANGTLTKANGTTWEMKVTWKDG